MSSHVMIDLETLGSTPGCAILSIGAVRFLPHLNGLQAEMYSRVNLQSCLNAGLKVEADTFYWWLDQSEQARKALHDDRLYNLEDNLIALREFINPEDFVWGHGSSFDLAVLATAYKAVGLPKPWEFRQERDTRTLLHQAMKKVGWNA